jgi:hypothetical protein
MRGRFYQRVNLGFAASTVTKLLLELLRLLNDEAQADLPFPFCSFALLNWGLPNNYLSDFKLKDKANMIKGIIRLNSG